MERTTCCIIGGGPAGMVLGLLLSRAGVDVTVLEKHDDFLRDFRGDTVHPTTLRLLDDLGLAEKFAKLPQRRIHRVQLPIGENDELLTFGDFTLLHDKHNYIAMVPQWDFLDLLAEEGKKEPSFSLCMNTEVTDFIRERGRINGVRYRTVNGDTGEIRSTITISCDGRDSLTRSLPELEVENFPTPMDVRWFRVPRLPSDPEGGLAAIREGSFIVLIDRGDYYQVGHIIGKGTDAEARSHPIEELDRLLSRAMPWLSGRQLVSSWDDVKLLHVTLDRLRKWHTPGLLAIGDAAHAMSPVGGIGINLAVQDAVATARYLAAPLREGRLRRRHVAAVQCRRWPTTVLTQGLQRIAHRNVIERALNGELTLGSSVRIPLPLRLAQRMPWLRRIPPYFLAYGAMQERPPQEALRENSSSNN